MDATTQQQQQQQQQQEQNQQEDALAIAQNGGGVSSSDEGDMDGDDDLDDDMMDRISSSPSIEDGEQSLVSLTAPDPVRASPRRWPRRVSSLPESLREKYNALWAEEEEKERSCTSAMDSSLHSTTQHIHMEDVEKDKSHHHLLGTDDNPDDDLDADIHAYGSECNMGMDDTHLAEDEPNNLEDYGGFPIDWHN